MRGYLQDYATPAGTRLQVWADESWTVTESLDLVIQNGTFGLVLVFLTLLLVFDLRIAAWVTLGVPVIFVGAPDLLSPFSTCPSTSSRCSRSSS